MVQKNEDISESVNSIDSGAIPLPRSGQELSRNAIVVSVYAFKKNLSWRIGFCMTPKIEIFMKFRVFSNFRKSDLSKRFGDFGRPCRGLSPGKGFAPKRISHMTRRAFLSSKSNTGAGEIEFKMACQKCW